MDTNTSLNGNDDTDMTAGVAIAYASMLRPMCASAYVIGCGEDGLTPSLKVRTSKGDCLTTLRTYAAVNNFVDKLEAIIDAEQGNTDATPTAALDLDTDRTAGEWSEHAATLEADAAMGTTEIDAGLRHNAQEALELWSIEVDQYGTDALDVAEAADFGTDTELTASIGAADRLALITDRVNALAEEGEEALAAEVIANEYGEPTTDANEDDWCGLDW